MKKNKQPNRVSIEKIENGFMLEAYSTGGEFGDHKTYMFEHLSEALDKAAQLIK